MIIKIGLKFLFINYLKITCEVTKRMLTSRNSHNSVKSKIFEEPLAFKKLKIPNIIINSYLSHKILLNIDKVAFNNYINDKTLLLAFPTIKIIRYFYNQI